MPTVRAIKRLSASDCTLFKGVFRAINKGNQKSINLNADVLTGRLYPGLPAAAAATNNEIALALTIYGPDAKEAHKLARKIIKTASYKNWRLNGEFIPGPPNDPARYDGIQPGDLAIMSFTGEIAPRTLDLILVSRLSPTDAALHISLEKLFGDGGRSMIAVTPAQITEAADAASVMASHPVYIVAADADMETALEDAALGGLEGTSKLLQNKRNRLISAQDLAAAKARAGAIGMDGEGLIDTLLAAQTIAGKLANYRWVASENAIAPYDFETLTPSGEKILIDVKTTSGPFENVIHLSIAEIIQAADTIPYRIYRVFDLNDNGGWLRISDTINLLARRLKALHENHMPPGVRVDGFSIATSAMTWCESIYVERPDE
ncbi:protein NO VEIN domain-containing protein [Acidisphaera rubrifaciens]|uniref:Protein NO VEIN C-terminal domain-containing protein n=1 Tax=Acidisphaera rubrifaciens HS-AP3 TaxID=1231350 RepID=A0A0D6P7J0_9PROT|nr:DUF3883 domain-containing protein [Acidisphaera rubrifaciens]GAN77311.1 hypothetical protein Asru_0281_07 [Acidisphaera rubrifaciens HS-AP3]